MGMYFCKDDGDEMIDGVSSGFVAVQRKDANGNKARIEIWCDDFECHYGNLPAGDWTLTQINAAISMFDSGRSLGMEQGKAASQRSIRLALGITG